MKRDVGRGRGVEDDACVSTIGDDDDNKEGMEEDGERALEVVDASIVDNTVLG